MSRRARIIVVGSLNIDFVLGVERLPSAGETLRGGDLALVPGGKGANQACAAGRLAGSAVMIGQVGR
ncbi:MAG: PfkB family carbohydrate kinase, partial [Bryobacteraceae bacterium]